MNKPYRLPTGAIISTSDGQHYYAIPVTGWTTFWFRVWGLVVSPIRLIIDRSRARRERQRMAAILRRLR